MLEPLSANHRGEQAMFLFSLCRSRRLIGPAVMTAEPLDVDVAVPDGSPVVAALAVATAAALFGTSFLVMKAAVEDVEPLPFLAVRFGVGALALTPFARRPDRPGVARSGALAGGVLAVGYIFQTTGLQYTTSSVSAFITYLLVVMVPLIVAVVSRRLPPATTAAGVALAVAGLVLLTGGSVGFGKGEALTLGCAFSFAVHIVVLAEFAPRFDAVRLTAVQLAVAAAVLGLPGLAFGGYGLTWTALLAAVYTGVAVSAAAFFLQVWGQRVLGATRTALLLMLEPVFAAVLGYVAGERLGIEGTVGAVLILVGIAVAEVPGVLTRRSISRQSEAAG
jgi:drug/metabolite transporter (DMT)-like permease